MNGLVDILIQSSDKEMWKTSIKQEFKEDLPTLETFVPRLKDSFENDIQIANVELKKRPYR